MMGSTVLWIHVASGALGVLLGPAVAYVTWRRRVPTTLGDVYHWVVLSVCVSAAALAVLSWSRLWWFLPIAAGSYGFALAGYVAGRRRRPGWLAWYLRGMGGSYIALITAILVVSVPGAPLTWLLPTLAGAPILEWLSLRSARGGSSTSAP